MRRSNRVDLVGVAGDVNAGPRYGFIAQGHSSLATDCGCISLLYAVWREWVGWCYCMGWVGVTVGRWWWWLLHVCGFSSTVRIELVSSKVRTLMMHSSDKREIVRLIYIECSLFCVFVKPTCI